MQEPDPALIRRAQQGDMDAFAELVRACQADCWRFARSLLHDRHAADDVTQEAFLRAYRFLGSYRGESRFSTWLFRLVHNCAMDEVRRIERARRPGPAPAPGTDVHARAEIREALDALPAALREPFLLVEVFGLRYADSAAVLGVKEGTVKSRVHRARAALIASLTVREAADGL